MTWFLWIAASSADPAPVNSNGIKTLVDSVLRIFIKGNPFFSNGPKTLLENPPDGPILRDWVLDNFILADEYLKNLYEALKLVY